MRKTIIFAAFAAALALASCTKDAQLSQNADLGINFRVTSQMPTKATATTVANLGGFKVTAIGNSANYFTDLDVAVTSAGVCTPAKTYYWPAYELGFFAYANPSGGTASITNASKTITGVTPVAAAASQADFVVSYKTGTKASNMASGVALNFRHALSQIQVKAANKSTSGLKINVKGVKVANVKSSGDFTYPASVTDPHNGGTLGFALWNSASASKTAYTIGGDGSTPVALNGTAASIMFDGTSWMLIPQQLVAWDLSGDKTNASANAYIGVYLQILDAADNLLYPASGYAYANVPIDTKWEPGKRYTYTLNFLDEANGGGAGVDDNGDPVLGNPIKFTLTVDDWDDASAISIDMPQGTVAAAPAATFGGLQISSGPLVYKSGTFEISNDWAENSYGTAYGLQEGSTYFDYEQMGKLFENASFTVLNGNIDNNLDPLSGWRIPTKSEWETILTTSSAVRSGSTVNGAANKHYAAIQLTGATAKTGWNTPSGVLVFPDGKTITGKALTTTDSNIQTTGVTISELNNYLEQGCIFLLAAGKNDDNGNNEDGGTYGYYWSSTQRHNDEIYITAFSSAMIAPDSDIIYEYMLTTHLVHE